MHFFIQNTVYWLQIWQFTFMCMVALHLQSVFLHPTNGTIYSSTIKTIAKRIPLKHPQYIFISYLSGTSAFTDQTWKTFIQECQVWLKLAECMILNKWKMSSSIMVQLNYQQREEINDTAMSIFRRITYRYMLIQKIAWFSVNHKLH